MIVPDYFPIFKCIGNECEDTCCVGWKVTIDKDTYKKYTQIKNIDFRKKVIKNISKNRASEKNAQYKIKLLKGLICPFLNENKLCDIFINCDESYLSSTCTNYPRSGNYKFNDFEMHLTLSCPEVVNKALLNEKTTELIKIEDDKKYISDIKQLPPKNINRNVEILKKINRQVLHTLQKRDYDIEVRLFLSGLFIYRVEDTYKQTGHFNTVNKVIDEFKEIVSNHNSWSNEFKQYQSAEKIKMTIFFTVLVQSLKSDNPRLQECLNWFTKGVAKYDTTTDADDSVRVDETIELAELSKRYNMALKEYYLPFVKEHGYILENYLVSLCFNTQFPMHPQNKFFDSYIKLVIKFITVKMMIIGMSMFHKKVELPHVLQFIQSYEKLTSHSNIHMLKLTDLLHKHHLDDLQSMLALLKDEIDDVRVEKKPIVQSKTQDVEKKQYKINKPSLPTDF